MWFGNSPLNFQTAFNLPTRLLVIKNSERLQREKVKGKFVWNETENELEFFFMSERDLLKRITMNPEICHGNLTVRGLRYRVVDILEMLASDMTFEEILNDYPDLEEEDLKACLLFASKVVDFGSIFDVLIT